MFSRNRILLLLSSLFGVSFIAITFFVLKGSFLSIDSYIDQVITIKFSSPLYLASRILAYLYVPLIIAMVLLLRRNLVNKQNFEALMLLAVFLGGLIAELVLKPIFRIPCPQTYYADVLSNKEVFGLIGFFHKFGLIETCYPSGHVASYVVFSGYLAYLVLKFVKKTRTRSILLVILLSIIVLVGPSRIYLHVHWLSDVIAGYFLGFAVLLFLISLRSRL